MEQPKSLSYAVIIGLLSTHCSSATLVGRTPTNSKPPATADANHAQSASDASQPQSTTATPQTARPQTITPRASPGTDSNNNAATNVLPSLTNTTEQSFTTCSNSYEIMAIANPYLAGVPSGTSLTYDLSQGGGPNPTDVAPDQAPVQVMPIGGTSCVQPGLVLYFAVNGRISHEGSYYSDANGNTSEVVHHQKGAALGKSDIAAPINSLLGVFLGHADPSPAQAPAGLDFSAQNARNYVTLQPAIGQVFFIGTGVTGSGIYHQVTVPAGATRFYFAVMDSYQWNNNSGYINGAIMVKK